MSNNLILCIQGDSRPWRQAEFTAAAHRLASLWGGANIVGFHRADHMLDAVAGMVCIKRLAIVSHGWPVGIGRRRARGIRTTIHKPPYIVDVDTFARVLGPRLAPESHVALAACSTGASRWHWRWSWRSYGPAQRFPTFADELYWGLCQWSDVDIIAHSAAGHTTRNVGKRKWSRYLRGISMMDVHFGPGAHEKRAQRREWVRLMKREDDAGYTNAERLMAGLPLA